MMSEEIEPSKHTEYKPRKLKRVEGRKPPSTMPEKKAERLINRYLDLMDKHYQPRIDDTIAKKFLVGWLQMRGFTKDVYNHWVRDLDRHGRATKHILTTKDDPRITAVADDGEGNERYYRPGATHYRFSTLKIIKYVGERGRWEKYGTCNMIDLTLHLLIPAAMIVGEIHIEEKLRRELASRSTADTLMAMKSIDKLRFKKLEQYAERHVAAHYYGVYLDRDRDPDTYKLAHLEALKLFQKEYQGRSLNGLVLDHAACKQLPWATIYAKPGETVAEYRWREQYFGVDYLCRWTKLTGDERKGTLFLEISAVPPNDHNNKPLPGRVPRCALTFQFLGEYSDDAPQPLDGMPRMQVIDQSIDVAHDFGSRGYDRAKEVFQVLVEQAKDCLLIQ